MTDKKILYPLVKESDIIYTTYKISPNQITFLNNLFITPLLFLCIQNNYYFISYIFVYIREYLDSLDGYIARKYNLCSKEGEIYDHFCDAIFIGMMTTTLSLKLPVTEPYSISLGTLSGVSSTIINYDKRLQWIAKYIGAGGNEEGYTFIMAFIPVFFFHGLWLCSLV